MSRQGAPKHLVESLFNIAEAGVSHINCGQREHCVLADEKSADVLLDKSGPFVQISRVASGEKFRIEFYRHGDSFDTTFDNGWSPFIGANSLAGMFECHPAFFQGVASALTAIQHYSKQAESELLDLCHIKSEVQSEEIKAKSAFDRAMRKFKENFDEYFHGDSSPPPCLSDVEGLHHEKMPADMIGFVYFLVRDDVVVYVGETDQWHPTCRIKSHFRDKDFDSVYYLKVVSADRKKIESEYIAKFNPEYNRKK